MQIVLFLIFTLAIIVIFVSKKDSLSNSVKIGIFSTIGVVLVLIYFYQSTTDSEALHVRDIVTSFKQGKSVTCKELKIDNKSFIYVSGTQTFMPAKENTKQVGVLIQASDCAK